MNVQVVCSLTREGVANKIGKKEDKKKTEIELFPTADRRESQRKLLRKGSFFFFPSRRLLDENAGVGKEVWKV